MVRAYWPRYRREAWIITILMQLAIVAAVGLAMMLAGIHPSTPGFIIIIMSVGILTLALNIVLVNLLLAPLRDLAAALTHISGEPTDTTPPNPNAAHFERDGFKPLLDLIYQVAAAPSTGPSNRAGANSSLTGQLLNEAFAHGHANIIIMDSDGNIQYASPHAPVKTDSNGRQSLQLVFDDDKSFDRWRQDNIGKLVRASNSWSRIANGYADSSERKFYNLTASYEQGSAAEIVLMLIDRTNDYKPEEDQLDFISFAAHELRGPVTVRTQGSHPCNRGSILREVTDSIKQFAMLKLAAPVITAATSQEPEWDYEDAKQTENNDIPHKHKHPYTHNETEGNGDKYEPLEHGVARVSNFPNALSRTRKGCRGGYYDFF